MNRKIYSLVLNSLLFAITLLNCDRAFGDGPSADRGRYLVKMSGCNDCHTANYGLTNGKVPEDKWLMGDPTGWKGPWGTTYAINLRTFVAPLTEDQWVNILRTVEARPPMPWYAFREMEDKDLRSIYRYITSLGSAGEEMPAATPPGVDNKPPYWALVLPQTDGTVSKENKH